MSSMVRRACCSISLFPDHHELESLHSHEWHVESPEQEHCANECDESPEPHSGTQGIPDERYSGGSCSGSECRMQYTPHQAIANALNCVFHEHCTVRGCLTPQRALENFAGEIEDKRLA